MKFMFNSNGTDAICNSCNHMFPLNPLPQPNRNTHIICPACGQEATYWIGWYINEPEDDDVVIGGE